MQSVRYVLIDEAVVKGERPASYWSRSQGVQFQTAFNKEEAELHHQSTDGNTLTQLSIGAGAKEPKKIRGWMS